MRVARYKRSDDRGTRLCQIRSAVNGKKERSFIIRARAEREYIEATIGMAWCQSAESPRSQLRPLTPTGTTASATLDTRAPTDRGRKRARSPIQSSRP